MTQLCGAEQLRVDDAWLAANLDAGELDVVDVRSSADFQASRIPGALHVDVNDVRTTVDGIGGQVASQQVVEDVLTAAGLRPDVTTVVYGAATEPTPARLVWTLHYFGVENTRLLDGGWGAWTAGGHATDATAPIVEPSAFTVELVDQDLRVDSDWIVARLDDPSVVLVDARSSGEFVAGHIPGALSIDWNTNVSGGSLLPRDQVEALYAGIDPTATVVAYCQTGSRASVTYFVLRWLGFADVRLYDGSWAEWESKPELPKETG